MKKIIYFSIFTLVLCGCSDFLKQYSLENAYIQSPYDLDELLLGDVYMDRTPPNENRTLGSNGNHYFEYVHYMSDELQQRTGDYDYSKYIFGYFTWQYDVELSYQGDFMWDEEKDFAKMYKHINAANTILAEAGEFDVRKLSTAEAQVLERVRGEAHFMRASYYFFLVNLYAKPYNPATAGSDPGVPLKTSQYVEHRPFSRNSVAEVYGLIESDLLEAERLLADKETVSVNRADRTAARLMLSRVYLYMQRYDECIQYSEKVISAGHTLLNLNLATVSNGNLPQDTLFSRDVREVIFSSGSAHFVRNIASHPSAGVETTRGYEISDELYDSYSANDLRVPHYVFRYQNSTRLIKIKTSGGAISQLSSSFLLRSAEAYLNLAEAAAMKDDPEKAYDALNLLLQNRIESSAFDTGDVRRYTGESLVNFVREERRRELCLESHRWFDLRRYQVTGKYPYSKSIVHTMSLYEGNSWDGYNLVINGRFELLPEDPAWTLQLPKKEISRNYGSMTNNERTERTYTPIN